jgi:hypothetical protein
MTPPAYGEPVEDLFGETHIEDQKPRRGTREYLALLTSFKLPDGLTFWDQAPQDALAELPSRDRKHVDVVWCRDRQGRFVKLLVDLRTGRQYGGGR